MWTWRAGSAARFVRFPFPSPARAPPPRPDSRENCGGKRHATRRGHGPRGFIPCSELDVSDHGDSVVGWGNYREERRGSRKVKSRSLSTGARRLGRLRDRKRLAGARRTAGGPAPPSVVRTMRALTHPGTGRRPALSTAGRRYLHVARRALPPATRADGEKETAERINGAVLDRIRLQRFF